METGVGKAGHFGSFGIELLDVVFAEIPQAELVCLANGGGGEDFGDGQQQDRCRVAVGAAGGAGHAIPHGCQSLPEVLHHRWLAPV